jgi:hypothetical protein
MVLFYLFYFIDYLELTPEIKKILLEESVLLLSYTLPSLQDLLLKLLIICIVEGVIVNIEEMKQLISLYHYDIRKLLNTCQFWFQNTNNIQYNQNYEQIIQNQTILPEQHLHFNIMDDIPKRKISKNQNIIQQLNLLSLQLDIASFENMQTFQNCKESIEMNTLLK